jgi:hypothetical protein
MTRTALATLVLLSVAGATVRAHRLDEYLQAARVSITTERVAIELGLTPGISLADAFIARLDRDRDGMISPVEAEQYGDEVVADLKVSVDAQSLSLTLRRIDVPPAGELRDGVGTIRLEADAPSPAWRTGQHLLRLENGHRVAQSVYLANALWPDDGRIAIRRQDRNPTQRVLDVRYDVMPTATGGFAWFLVAGALLVGHARIRRLAPRTTLE